MFLSFFFSSFLITIISCVVLTPPLRKHLLKQNFRGRNIPSGSGLIILITYVLILLFYVFFHEQELIILRKWLLPLTMLVVAMGTLGFLDDLFGSREVGGFKGHFRELFKGHITTGVVKAIGGIIICLVVARFFSTNIATLVVNGLLMALFANLFNLLDLRPGRAIKLFLILGIVVFLFSMQSTFWVLSGIFLGTLTVLLWADLSETCMLGDVGSNVLGAVIGFSVVVNFKWITNAVILLIIALIQVYAESHSITAFIEKNSFLRILDEFGRRRERREISKRYQRMI